MPQGHPLSGGYDVVGCRFCCFVYADIIQVQKDYDAFYATFSKYEDKKTATGGGITSWDVQRLEETAKYLAVKWPEREKSIVDIGCANGGLLYQLKKLGYKNLYGIDPSASCVKNIRELGISSSVGSLFSLPGNIAYCERIILSHVLEHVADLNGAISSVHARMAMGGQMYIELPDASRYVEAVFSPFQEFNTEHINYFSSLTCANLMHSNGFVIKEQGKRLIESSPGKPYPVIYSLCLKDSCRRQVKELQRDDELKFKINAYITKSQEMMDGIETILVDITKRYPKIILWGTGQLLMKILAGKSLKNAGIIAFVDGNPVNHGKYIGNIPILAPEQIRHYDSPILITTLIHQQEISETIRRMGISNEVLCI